MKPYYEHNGITIYHGDCREILPQLAPDSVDLVLTDPPYGVQYVAPWRPRTDPLVHRIPGDDDCTAIVDAVQLSNRLLRDNRHVYFFAASMRTGDTIDAMETVWKVKNVLIWYKGESGTVGDVRAGFGYNYEPIIYANKGRRPLNGPRPRTVIRYDWNGSRDPVHPTVKPVGLLRILIQFSSHPGEVVLDPFMGSGTTLRAAKDLGRQAIGIEIEERYCEVAAKRLAQGVLALDG